MFYHFLLNSGCALQIVFFLVPFEDEAYRRQRQHRGNEGADIPIASYTTMFVLLPSLKNKR